MTQLEINKSKWKIGKLYSVPWSPNPHKLVSIEAAHCQMHGDFIGYEVGFIKKRNSEKRPWGYIACTDRLDENYLNDSITPLHLK